VNNYTPSNMASSSLYFENNLASISSHPAGYVQLTYQANEYTLEELRIVLGHVGDLLRRYRWHMLLENHQQLVSLSAGQQGMMLQYLQRQTSSLNRPLCVATVLAQNVFVRLAVAALRHKLQTTNTAINYRSFSDTVTASSWMLQVGGS
jgi:hypothetical protein